MDVVHCVHLDDGDEVGVYVRGILSSRKKVLTLSNIFSLIEQLILVDCCKIIKHKLK